MSDLLIKNVELPPSNKQLLLCVSSDGTVYSSVIGSLSFTETKAALIPPHGDLIERDWMREAFYRYAKTGGVLYDLADKAPAIIPASEERT
jgi:hypothetical protein